MFSPETIRDMSRDAGEAAEASGDGPYVYWRGDPARRGGGFPFPNLGDFRPTGWEHVGNLFADMTGWGGDTEPALSVGQLETRILEIRLPYEAEGLLVGFGIIEVGQFQCVIGVFENVNGAPESIRRRARAEAELGFWGKYGNPEPHQ